MKIFESARLKLTTWYLIIIMLLSISVSIGVYKQVDNSTRRALIFHEKKIDNRLRDFNLGNKFPPPEQFQKIINEETVKDIKEHTFIFLVVMNTLILILSGGLGYFLAGKTLMPIEEMVDKQKNFIADAAHEIKTPLTAMKTMLEVQLRNKNLNVEDAKKSMESILDEVDSLSLLTIKLLDESKYQNTPTVFEKISLNDQVEVSLKKFEGMMKAKNIRLEKSLNEKVFINGDKKLIRELVSILLDNAIKFNKENDGSIKIVLANKKGKAKLEIINTGKGILLKDQAKIFDRFYKVDKSRTKSNERGYGLGLSIAKEIVAKHTGEIEVKSEMNKETSFTIYLPRA